MTADTLIIDDSPPLPVCRPSSTSDLCEMVQAARGAGQGIYPVGGRTTLDIGLPPTKPGIAVDMTALNQVIDYPARDMTVTVQAGITIAALQEELAKEGQWLPIDVTSPERATLGGAIAVNQSGPHRYGYGTLRDYILGMSFVTDEGVEVKAGGRVVKNVAGYDFMKLQTGALGTLGVITHVTLKVKPRPEAYALLVFKCSQDSLSEVLNLLHASRSRPVIVELLNSEACQAGDLPFPTSEHEWTLAVGFEEKETTVRWQVMTLLNELRTAPVRDVAELNEASGYWTRITQLQTHPASSFIGKANLLPSQLAQALRNKPPVIIHAHALNGIIWQHGPKPVEELIIRRCPVEAKRTVPIWGKPTSAWNLMRHIKKTLDPGDVFNPGRLFNSL